MGALAGVLVALFLLGVNPFPSEALGQTAPESVVVSILLSIRALIISLLAMLSNLFPAFAAIFEGFLNTLLDTIDQLIRQFGGTPPPR